MQYHFSQNMIAGFNDRKDNARLAMYKSYLPVITEKVKDLMGNSCDHQDIVFEAVTRILENDGEFENVRRLEKFIKKVATNVCIDEQRKLKTRVEGTPHMKD